MNCQILSTLYLKSNGDIPCEDDFGERVSLGQVSIDKNWSITQILDGPRVQHIRTSFLKDDEPWPNVCERCALLRRYQACDDWFARRRIRKLQVEPSLACTLRCPCCSQPEQIKVRPKPHIMDIAIFRRLLESCAEANYTIDCIEYCGQGEPLTHPRFAELVRIGREIFPLSRQRLVTNANYSYHEKIAGEYIDEIYVSCDGVFQTNYEKYRRRGSVEKPLKFMRDAGRIDQAARPLVVWKYILFEFNDSKDELKAAQTFALEANVGMLMFVLTQTDFRSRTYNVRNFQEALLHAPNARLSTTPGFLREQDNNVRVSTGADLTCIERSGSATLCHLDKIELYPGIITLSGWAFARGAHDQIAEISIAGDRRRLGVATQGALRLDVLRVHPEAATPHTGYAFAGRWAPSQKPAQIEMVINTRSGATDSYTFATTGTRCVANVTGGPVSDLGPRISSPKRI